MIFHRSSQNDYENLSRKSVNQEFIYVIEIKIKKTEKRKLDSKQRKFNFESTQQVKWNKWKLYFDPFFSVFESIFKCGSNYGPRDSIHVQDLIQIISNSSN